MNKFEDRSNLDLIAVAFFWLLLIGLIILSAVAINGH